MGYFPKHCTPHSLVKHALFAQRRLITAFLAFTLIACARTPIVENLSQRQAQEIAAVLLANGIDAVVKKTGRGNSPVFNVEIDERFYSRAIVLLHEKNLPREETRSFDDIINQSGLLPPSRDIEALRTDRALALEAQELIRVLPGVVEARVAVRQYSAPSPESQSVSVVVQVKKDAPITVETLKGIANQTVPLVKNEKISVLLETERVYDAKEIVTSSLVSGHPAISLVPFLWLGRIPAEDYTRIALVLIGCFLLTTISGCILGYWWGMSRTSLRNRSAQRAQSARIEGADLRLDRVRRGIEE